MTEEISIQSGEAQEPASLIVDIHPLVLGFLERKYREHCAKVPEPESFQSWVSKYVYFCEPKDAGLMSRPDQFPCRYCAETKRLFEDMIRDVQAEKRRFDDEWCRINRFYAGVFRLKRWFFGRIFLRLFHVRTP